MVPSNRKDETLDRMENWSERKEDFEWAHLKSIKWLVLPDIYNKWKYHRLVNPKDCREKNSKHGSRKSLVENLRDLLKMTRLVKIPRKLSWTLALST